jgi:hypothetical protein
MEFAFAWLRGTADDTVRTVLVATVVDELLTVLRAEHLPIQIAYRSLRRAVRLLSIFAEEPQPRGRQRSVSLYDGRVGRVIQPEEIARATEARRFAKATLHGSVRQAIRTGPVIELVDSLLGDLMHAPEPGDAHAALRRAVKLLSIYVVRDE